MGKSKKKMKKEYTDAFKKAAKGGKGVIKGAKIKMSANPGITITGGKTQQKGD